MSEITFTVPMPCMTQVTPEFVAASILVASRIETMDMMTPHDMANMPKAWWDELHAAAGEILKYVNHEGNGAAG